MKLKVFIIIAFVVANHCWTFGQSKQATIKADLSGYTEKLPVSSDPIWEGADTLVPLTVNASVPKAMGAEYIIFPYRLDGDSLSPNSDDKRKKPYLWRTKASIQQQIYTWQFALDKPCIIQNISILGGDYLVLPGDSVFITFHQGKPVFAGKGAAKFQTQYEMKKASEAVPYPAGEKYPKSLSRYQALHYYLNNQIIMALQILESRKPLLSQYEYDWLKASFLGNAEYSRWLYFYVIPNPAYRQSDSLPYSTNDLVKVWDSTMYQSNANWFRSPDIQNLPGIGGRGYSKSFISTELLRKAGFMPADTIANQQIFKKLAYYKIKNSFSGVFRERFLCYFIREEFIQEMGSYNWITQSILKDYYATPGFPAYKKWMKEYENEHQYLSQGVNGGAPLFNLTDLQGNTFRKKRTDGKFTVVNFWYTGCESCKQTAKDLKNLQEKYKRDTNVLFLNVSVDPDKQLWKKSIEEGKYVAGGIQLYTGGKGKEHEMVKDFNVTSYPTVRAYNQKGYIVFDSKEPFAATFSEKQLSAIIEGQLSKFDDGPYVFHENGKVKTYTIDKDKAIEGSLKQLRSATDEFDRPLQLNLHKKISVPVSTYPAASRLLVLSDIEGNFTPFKKLLQANGVMDDNFNWKFGKGHLVFAGDMFDRGDQVTECLWLVYSLEEKAKAAGGMVHFILGNHEIMNLQGNHKYVVDKYKKNAELMGKTLTQLYNEDSELGKWLRSKNIVEKIGDLLFMHGGVSSELNNTPVTIAEINQLARPHYADTTRAFADPKLNTIMSSSVGPFWFRGYYQGMPVESMIDSTFKKFDVKHIVTGHTIVADVITTHYGGKIINTDVPHASGKSEALLIEGDRFYRVNTEGKKVLLFTDDKRKVSGK